MRKIDVTVVIPVLDFDEHLLSNAIQSIENQKEVIPTKILVVTPTAVAKKLKTFDFKTLSDSVEVVTNKGETDFASQVNLGVEKADTEWVSILEIDDEYSKVWFKNVDTYVSAHKKVDVFLPITVDVDHNGHAMGTTNEAVWAYQFSDDHGYLDLNALLSFNHFSLCGGVFRKSLFEEFGGYKSSIKLMFTYELLLRLAYNDATIMTIPKIGYKHMNMRPGGIFDSYKLTMNPVESKWWFELARREYYFKDDRNITYESNPIIDEQK
jgi:hypothetical protein